MDEDMNAPTPQQIAVLSPTRRNMYWTARDRGLSAAKAYQVASAREG